MAETSRLPAALSSLGLLDQSALDEACARELIFGGPLELCVLELDLLGEADLLKALAEATGYEPAPPGPLAATPRATQAAQTVHPGLAAAYREGDVPLVFASEDVPREVLPALDEALGDAPEHRVCSSLRIREVLGLLAQVELSEREQAVLQKLGRRLETFKADPEPRAPPAQARIEAPSRDESPLAHTASSPLEDEGPLLDQSRTPSGYEPAIFETRLAGTKSSAEETAPPPADYEQVRRSVVPPAAPPAQGPRAARTEAPPPITYSLKDAHRDLNEARDRDRIVSVVLAYVGQFFEYTAVFAIQSKEARGLASAGPGAPPERVLDLHIPLDLPSAFERVRETGTHRLARLRASGLEGGIVRDLERPAGRAVLLVPITVRGRALLLIWGDDGQDDVDVERSAPALSIGPFAAAAIERVLIQRKRVSKMSSPSLIPKVGTPDDTHDPPAPSWSRPPTSGGTPGARSKAPGSEAAANGVPPEEVGAENVGPTEETRSAEEVRPAEDVRPPEKPGAPGPADPRHASPDPGPSRTALGMSLPPRSVAPRKEQGPGFNAPEQTDAEEPRQDTRHNLAPPAAGLRDAALSSAPPPLGHEVAPAKKRALPFVAGASSDPPARFPSDVPKTMKGFPGSHDLRLPSAVPSAVRSPVPRVAAPLLSRRIVPVSEDETKPGEGPTSRAPHDVTAEQAGLTELAAQLERAEPAETEQPQTEQTAQPQTEPQTHTAPDSSRTMLSRRPAAPDDKPPSSASAEARSPLPQRALSYSELVDHWLGGNGDALRRLVDGGESAVGALIARFPGPVTEPENAKGRASACGPILAALAAFGAKAAPFVTVRTADEDPAVRRWAVFLLGELGGREAARAIADRLLDDTVIVRRAALASARRIQADELTRRTLRARLEEMTRDTQLMTEERCAALEAIADIREHLSIPTLLKLLDDESPAIRRAAKWALSVLTRQDFADDVASWQAFWQEHRNEAREEWLIFALLQQNEDLRKAAADELAALVGAEIPTDLDEEGVRKLRETVRGLRARPA